MSNYRVHRIKDAPAEAFRWELHTGGLVTVKPKDYEPGRQVEASTPYIAWKLLENDGQRLRPGDLLEVVSAADSAPGTLFITKYIGFEPAQWFVPEPKNPATPASYEAGNSEAQAQASDA